MSDSSAEPATRSARRALASSCRPNRGRPGLSLAAAGLAIALGCASFDKLASEDAHDQQTGSEVIRREGALAYALCRQEASFAYLVPTLGFGPDGGVAHPPMFADWYRQTRAMADQQGNPVPWESYCDHLNQTGALYNLGVVALAKYASGIEALTDAKAFDPSGLNAVGTAAGSVGTSLNDPSGLSSAAASVASAAAGLANPVVTYVRIRELKSLLTESDKSVTGVLKGLDAYLVALEDLQKGVVLRRNKVLILINAGRNPDGGFASSAEGALAFDLAQGAELDLDRTEHHIAADRKLVAAIVRAHDSLVSTAKGGSDDPTKAAVGELSGLIDALNRQQPEVP